MILYEERHFLFAHKVAGISSQRVGACDDDPTMPQDTLEQQLEKFILQRDGKLGFLQLVHRLDRVASGIILFARSSKALSRLHESLRARQWQKFYLAFVSCRQAIPDEDQLDDWLFHDDRAAMVVPASHPHAKLARLEYRVLIRHDRNALLGIRLHTGRYHQIRAQLSSRGWPILGDVAYGGMPFSDHSYPGIALHHAYLNIPRPIQQEPKGNQRAECLIGPPDALLKAVHYSPEEMQKAISQFQEWTRRICSVT